MNKNYSIWLRSLLAVCALFGALCAQAQPYMTPYTLAGWSSPLVVTTNSNSTTQPSPLYSTNELYIDWGVINDGTADGNSTFTVEVFTNSVLQSSYSVADGLQQNYYYYYTGIAIGQLPAGTNTVELVADATDVYETPPSTYTNTFVVLAPVLPNLTAPNPITPANASKNQSTSPEFTWSSVSNAQYYVIMVATNAADLPTNTTAVTATNSITIIADVTNTTFTPENPVVPGVKYYWEVNARYLTEGGPWSAVGSFTTATPTGGLVIIPSFDSTITSDPQAAIIEATINAAIGVYENDFSDPITVTITFEEMNSGLGESSWSYYTVPYSSYLSNLVAAASTADDATALAHLPAQVDNPVNSNASVKVKTALAWDLGLNGGASGENVGTVMLYTGIMNLSQAQNNPGNCSLFSTTCHEIDEVLATGSALDEVYKGDNTLSGPIFPEDLFRYDSSGNRSYTTSASASSYFSLDGTNDLAQFNQVGSGDFGDWYSYDNAQAFPQVQDAFAESGASPNPVVELRVLDVLGYHRAVQAPPPVFQSVTRVGRSINLVWSAVSGQNYQVEDSTNLALGVWNNLGGSIAATNSTASYTDAIGSNQKRFYRVELLGSSGSNLQPNRSQVIMPPSGWGTNVLHAYHP